MIPVKPGDDPSSTTIPDSSSGLMSKIKEYPIISSSILIAALLSGFGVYFLTRKERKI